MGSRGWGLLIHIRTLKLDWGRGVIIFKSRTDDGNRKLASYQEISFHNHMKEPIKKCLVAIF
jgi:hypothetical protein